MSLKYILVGYDLVEATGFNGHESALATLIADSLGEDARNYDIVVDFSGTYRSELADVGLGTITGWVRAAEDEA